MATVQNSNDDAGVAPRPASDVSSRIGSWTTSECSCLGKTWDEVNRPEILAKRLAAPRKETLRRRKERASKILAPLTLHDKVLTRLCRLSHKRLVRVTNFVESIKDAVVFSTPDVTSREALFLKLMRWAYSISVYRSDSGTAQWKKFGSLIKWYAFQSETDRPEDPTDLPGFGLQKLEEFPSFWFRLCPWLRTVVQHGAKSKLCLTRVAHLTSSRGLPAGDAKTREASLKQHKATLSSEPHVSEIRKALLYRLSELVGSKLAREVDYQSNAHLSLTSSSSFESMVKEGGRASEISEKFRKWTARVPQRTAEGTTLLGVQSNEIAGFPRWMTCGRKDYDKFIAELPHHSDGYILDDVEAGESRQDTFFDFENFVYKDPIYGLDQATGYQLHQWAVEELLDIGILTGDKHDPNTIQLNAEKLPLVRRSTIGEPGAKSRVITVAEACITIFLQPSSHHWTGWLRNHQSATAGLTRAAQGYEYTKGLHRKKFFPGEELDLKILTSDLSTATDYCVFDYSKAMLTGFTHGLRQDSQYHHLSAGLLCSSRCVVDGSETWVTKRGILMGDPGAKAVLTLHNLCAELEAFLRYRIHTNVTDQELLDRVLRMKEIPSAWWRHFACSGDDHVAIGPDPYLRGITMSHARNGMSVSWPQNFVSKVGGAYCEDLLLIRGMKPKDIYLNEYLWKLGYESHVNVDAIKLRLLSACSKEHEGKDETNAGIGKAHQLSKILAWLERPVDQLKRWSSERFSDRFAAFLPGSVEQYLPVSLGGLEAPGWHLRPEELVDEIIDLSPRHLSLIEKLLSGNATPLDRRVLGSFATNARARGISSDAIEDQVRDLLANEALTKAISVDELQSVIEVDPEDFKSWNFRKKMGEAKLAGFISINDAINLIERPYIFRDLLFPEMSRKHGIDPSANRAYQPVSWKRRKIRYTESVNEQVPEGTAMQFPAATAWTIAQAVTSGVLLEVPPSNLLIPRSVVEDESRPQLRTPYRC